MGFMTFMTFCKDDEITNMKGHFIPNIEINVISTYVAKFFKLLSVFLAQIYIALELINLIVSFCARYDIAKNYISIL